MRAPVHADYVALKSKLNEFVNSNPFELLRDLVRLSFHDLMNAIPFKQGGPHGCIAKAPIIHFQENQGLPEAVLLLQAFVLQNFPNISFSMGDVISLTGKVCIESAYPCVHVPWMYGRKACLIANETEAGTNGGIDTLASFSPFLVRYNLSALEMAILTAGTHGLKEAGAFANNTGFGTLNFAQETSGKVWLQKTLNNNWTGCVSDGQLFQYCAFDLEYNTTIMRLPSDMVFFPSVIEKTGSGVVDFSAKNVESALLHLSQQPQEVFNTIFASTYAKMLEIGTWNDALIQFNDSSGTLEASAQCVPSSFSFNSSVMDSPPPPFSPLGLIFLIIAISIGGVLFLILTGICCLKHLESSNPPHHVKKAVYCPSS